MKLTNEFVFQPTDNIAKDPPVKVDSTTEVDAPFSLKEVHVKGIIIIKTKNKQTIANIISDGVSLLTA